MIDPLFVRFSTVDDLGTWTAKGKPEWQGTGGQKVTAIDSGPEVFLQLTFNAPLAPTDKITVAPNTIEVTNELGEFVCPGDYDLTPA